MSATSAWGVGYVVRNATTNARSVSGAVAHWTGSSWQRVTAPTLTTGKDPLLTTVRATHSAGVWAVGQGLFGADNRGHQFVSRRFGDRWTNHDLGAGSTNADVRILGANDVWVLYRRTSGSPDVGIGEHWDGRSWTKVRLAALPAGEGTGRWASATAPGTGALELLHFDGRHRTVVAGPKITATRAPYCSGMIARDDSLFITLGNPVDSGDEDESTLGVILYERDAAGQWHERLSLPDTSAGGLTRTSADGVWLLDQGQRQLVHIVDGKVVSTSPAAPPIKNAVSRLQGISGTAGSPTVFAAVYSDDHSAQVYFASAATYRP